MSLRPDEPAHLPALTGLRGVAAWAIVWAHTLGQFVPASSAPLLYDTARLGLFGMSLFFVLSGFVIHYNYGAALAKGGGRSIWSFFVARFSRLFPLYLLVLAQTTANPVPFQKSAFHDLWPYFLTLSQGWFPIYYDGKLIYLLFAPLAWSVSAEVLLYLSYIPLAALLWRMSLKTTIWVACIAGAAFMLIRFENGLGLWRGIVDDYWAFYLSPYCRFPEFLIGALVAQIAHRQAGKSTAGRDGDQAILRRVLLAAGALWALMLYLAAYHPLYGDIAQHVQQSFGFVPTIAVLIYVCAVTPGRLSALFESRIAIALGDASYSTYMLHPYAMVPFVRWREPIMGAVGMVPAMAAMWLLIALISIAGYRLYELPAKRLLRRLLDRPVRRRERAT